jgi:hypothetical protein
VVKTLIREHELGIRALTSRPEVG